MRVRDFRAALLVIWSISAFAAAPPAITSVSDNPINAGGPYFRITLTGTGFVSGAIAYWREAPLDTFFVSATEITAAITNQQRSLSGRYLLRVENPDGGKSNSIPVLVSPVIATATPPGVLAGSSNTTVTVSGIGFIPEDRVALTIAGQQTSLATTWINPAKLTAVIPASALTKPASATLHVFDPLYGESSALLPFSIQGLPVITSAAPNTIDAGGPPFLMTIIGSGFSHAASATIAGVPLGTTFVSATELRVAITPEIRALSGVFQLMVTLPGGLVSAPSPILIMPVLAAITPSMALAGSGPVFITASGIGFTRNNVIFFNGSRLSTTFVNSASLSATLPASALGIPGTATIQVRDLGSTVSSSLQFVIRGAPVITTISPNPMDAGGLGLIMTVTGAGFISSSVLTWAGTPLGTLFSSPTQLTATITPSLRALAGTYNVGLTEAGGATLANYPVTISPVLFSVSPATAAALSPALTITASGAGLTRKHAITFNGLPLTTSYVSSTALTGVVPASGLEIPGAAKIQIVESAGPGRSTPLPFAVSIPTATIANLIPPSITIGSPAFLLTVTGTGFLRNSIVWWDGSTLATTYVSSTQLTASVPASLTAQVLTAAITAANPGGLSSNRLDFTVAQPRPAISMLAPSSVLAGAPATILTLAGSNFVPESIARWNGNPLLTTFISETRISASLTASLLDLPGYAAVTVMNPDGAISAPAIFAVSVAPPVLISLAPASVAAASGAFVLLVNGSNLAPSGAVQWDGRLLPTTFLNPSRLTAEVPAELTASAATAEITVLNPGGLISRPVVFLVTAPLPAISIDAVVNAFTSLSPIAPGSIISIYGKNLAGNGTFVTINGTHAPIFYAGALQINAQAPFETTSGNATLVVQSGTSRSAAALTVVPIAPGILTDPDNSLAVALNAVEGTQITIQNPAAPGQNVTLYLTGQGALDQPVATGAAGSGQPFAHPLAEVQVTLGGKEAAVTFAGLVPGLVGVLQVNMVVPELSTGEQPLGVTIGGVRANPAILPVRAPAAGLR